MSYRALDYHVRLFLHRFLNSGERLETIAQKHKAYHQVHQSNQLCGKVQFAYHAQSSLD